ncbi:MAG TPA: hypothetical protein VGZ00_09740 [Candidatus Baltobacteraceae bacterium]|jgi:hypothetical protein|nr:hypothetical protein [Candidatus Baltobacteraceae bacterium]
MTSGLRLLSLLLISIFCLTIRATASEPTTFQADAVRKDLQGPFVGDIRRVATSGNNALVYGSFFLDGALVKRELLLQYFPFGWQVVDVSKDDDVIASCDFQKRDIPSSVEHDLQQAIKLSTRPDPTICDEGRADADVGSPDDITELRASIAAEQLPVVVFWVRIADPYGLVRWYGAGGGSALYQRSNGNQWVFVRGTTGILDADTLVKDEFVSRDLACSIVPPQREWLSHCATQPR